MIGHTQLTGAETKLSSQLTPIRDPFLVLWKSLRMDCLFLYGACPASHTMELMLSYWVVSIGTLRVTKLEDFK